MSFRIFRFSLLVCLAALILSACSGGQTANLRILASTGMEDLLPVLEDWGKRNGRRISVDFMGGLDMAAALHRDASAWDCAWAPSGLWLSGLPSGVLEGFEPTMSSPLVWGLTPAATALFPAGKSPSTSDIIAAAKNGKLRVVLPEPLRTATGAAAALSLIQALSGTSAALDMDALQTPGLGEKLRALLPALDCIPGDAELAATIPAKTAAAIAISEYALIRWNQDAPEEQKLRASYPTDGVFLEDGPLVRIAFPADDEGRRERSRAAAALQAWLQSAEGRDALSSAGRRSWLGGSALNPKPLVFDPAWGIRTDRELSVLRQPRPEVAAAALSLLQSARRSPALTILCLDFSSSMAKGGKKAMIDGLISALEPAKGPLLPPSPFLAEDRVIFLPFAGSPSEDYGPTAPRDPAFAAQTLDAFADDQAFGSSDIYGAASRALARAEAAARESPLSGLRPHIVIITDGKDTDGSYGAFALEWKISLSKPAVSTVLLGDSDRAQVSVLARLSAGAVLDGRPSIAGAFREIFLAR